MELFKKMGPRSIMVEYRGRLVGLVTVKDVLKYQFKVEAREQQQHHGQSNVSHRAMVQHARQEKLWEGMRSVGEWVVERVKRASGGRIRLGSGDERDDGLWAGRGEMDPRDARRPLVGSEGAILDGTEDDGTEDGIGNGEEGVELRERI